MISLQSLGKKGPILTKHTFKLLFAVLDLFVLCMSLMQKKMRQIFPDKSILILQDLFKYIRSKGPKNLENIL